VKALERRANIPYQWNFVRRLKARMRRKAAIVLGLSSLKPLRRIWTVRLMPCAVRGPAWRARPSSERYVWFRS
jgi:hypothetical protein